MQSIGIDIKTIYDKTHHQCIFFLCQNYLVFTTNSFCDSEAEDKNL